MAFFIFGAICGLAFAAGEQPVAYQKARFGRITAHVVTADLCSKNVHVNLLIASRPLNNHKFPHEAFHAMIEKSLPTAAIDGTYYDTRTYKPVGTLVSKGEIVQSGDHGVAVCFDSSNHVYFYKIRSLKNFPWQNFAVILSSGPTLVENGRVHFYPYSERFRDPELFGLASRSAIGITARRKLLLVSVPSRISLREMARIMKKLGAVQAVNLDGGGSTALYYRGRFLSRPSRLLTNVLVIFEKKEAVGLRE